MAPSPSSSKSLKLLGTRIPSIAKCKRVQLLSAIVFAPSKKSVRAVGLKRTGAMAGTVAILKLGQKYTEARHK
jgi:hypothetical protein